MSFDNFVDVKTNETDRMILIFYWKINVRITPIFIVQKIFYYRNYIIDLWGDIFNSVKPIIVRIYIDVNSS